MPSDLTEKKDGAKDMIHFSVSPWTSLNYNSIPKRKKITLKRCPLGTVLKNGALFGKKGTKTVPLCQSAPPPKGHQRALFYGP